MWWRRQEVAGAFPGWGGGVPGIPSLQAAILEAWARGWDRDGADGLGMQLQDGWGRNKWIGTTEIAALLCASRVRARIVDFVGGAAQVTLPPTPRHACAPVRTSRQRRPVRSRTHILSRILLRSLWGTFPIALSRRLRHALHNCGRAPTSAMCRSAHGQRAASGGAVRADAAWAGGRLGGRRRSGIRRPSSERSRRRPCRGPPAGPPRRATPAWSVMHVGSALCLVRPRALTKDCHATWHSTFAAAAAMLLLTALPQFGGCRCMASACLRTSWRTTRRCGSMCACAWCAPTWTPVVQGHVSRAAAKRTTTFATGAIPRRRHGATTRTAAAPVTARPRPRHLLPCRLAVGSCSIEGRLGAAQVSVLFKPGSPDPSAMLESIHVTTSACGPLSMRVLTSCHAAGQAGWWGRSTMRRQSCSGYGPTSQRIFPATGWRGSGRWATVEGRTAPRRAPLPLQAAALPPESSAPGSRPCTFSTRYAPLRLVHCPLPIRRGFPQIPDSGSLHSYSGL